MARNEEKAMNLFNKWHTFKADFHAVGSNRRPLMASECDSLVDAEKWRREIIRDITKKIPMIQNANLGEFKIREMNDDLNKLMKQKYFWEHRIRELGGTDFKRSRQSYDIEGKELPGAPGYKYYGVAKDLPGVRELFAEDMEEQAERKNRRTRGDMFKHITPDYYGYRDDDDGVLAVKEAAREKELVRAAVDAFQTRKRSLQLQLQELNASITSTTNTTTNNNTSMSSNANKQVQFEQQQQLLAAQLHLQQQQQQQVDITAELSAMHTTQHSRSTRSTQHTQHTQHTHETETQKQVESEVENGDENDDNDGEDDEDDDEYESQIAALLGLDATCALIDTSIRSHVELPTQASIQAMVLEQKKLALLDKF